MDDMISCPKCDTQNQSVFIIYKKGWGNYVEYVMYYICLCGQEYLKGFKEYADYGYRTRHCT